MGIRQVDILALGGAKGRVPQTLFLTILLLGLAFSTIVTIPHEVQGSTIITLDDESYDGFIWREDAGISPPTTTTEVNSTGSKMYVTNGWSQSDGKYTYFLSRSYFSFDTSSLTLPEGAIVQSVTLNLKASKPSIYDGTTVNFYSGDYGASLDSGDWGSGSSYVGSIDVYDYTATWYQLYIPTGTLDYSGKTQFELRTPSDSPPTSGYPVPSLLKEEAQISTYETSDKPYMEITYYLPAGVNFELDDGSVESMDILPETEYYNETYEVYTFEFWVWDAVNNVTFSKGESSWQYFNSTPVSTSVSETSSQVTLTGVVTNCLYHVYFLVPIGGTQSTIYLSLFNSYNGNGIAWDTYKLSYSNGSSYDANYSSRITNTDFRVDSGETYTIAVFDWFDRQVTTRMFLASTSSVYVSIGVPITNLYIHFSDDRNHRFSLESEGVYQNMSFSPVPLVSSYDYNISVEGDQYIEALPSTTLPEFGGVSDIVTVNVTLKDQPSTLHFRYYDATGLRPGTGIAWESYPLYVDGNFTPFSWLDTSLNTTHELVVTDYFGNEIYNDTVVANSVTQLVEIPIDTYSWKLMNAQLDDPVKVKVWFNDSGAWVGPHQFYAGPGEVVERWFLNGTYRVQVTYYNNQTPGNAVYFNYNITGDATFLLVQEDQIQQLIENDEGILEYQQVITKMVTPDVIHIIEEPPCVPDKIETVLKIHPYAILTATVERDLNGTSMAFYEPTPERNASDYTIIQDTMLLSGPYLTEIWVNDTNGTSIFHSTKLPAYLNLNGQNLTVETNNSIHAFRSTKWREETLFYYDYYTTQRKYQVTLSLNNSMWGDWKNAYWFVGFPENSTIDLSSIRIFDVNNEAYLSPGQHYDTTSSGIHMAFDKFNQSTIRTFRITFYDSNKTDYQGTAIAYMDSYSPSTYDGEDLYKGVASWTNSFTYEYRGQCQIKLSFDKAQYIDPSSIIIIDNNRNQKLSDSEWTYSGTTITISSITAEIGQVYSFQVYFALDYSKAESFSLYNTFLGIPYIIFLVGAIVVSAVVGWIQEDLRNQAWIICIILIGITAFLVMLEEVGAFNGVIT